MRIGLTSTDSYNGCTRVFFKGVAAALFVLFLVVALRESGYAAGCSPADQIALAKSGYAKADIEKMCSAAAPAGSSAPSKPAASTSAKAASPKPEPKLAAAAAADSTQVLKEKTEAAAQAFKTHDYINAAHLFSEVVALNPNDALAWHFLGQSLANKGDTKDAMRAYAQSLALSPQGEVADRTRDFIEKAHLQDLGTMGATGAEPIAVTSDGAVIVGNLRYGVNFHVFRWTQKQGAQDLGTMGGTSASPIATSGDGAIIAGNVFNADGTKHVFRWTTARGAEDLGTMGGRTATVTGMSKDGSTIAGSFKDANNEDHAFRWTQTQGTQTLPSIDGKPATVAAISADGSVMIGSLQYAKDVYHALVWTQTESVQDVGTMGGVSASVAGISADGKTILGAFRDAEGKRHLFRRAGVGGVQELPFTVGTPTYATAISADGSAIVGLSQNDPTISNATDIASYQVVLWTNSRGKEDLGKMGGVSARATAITSDGSIVVGFFNLDRTLTDSHAFIYYRSEH